MLSRNLGRLLSRPRHMSMRPPVRFCGANADIERGQMDYDVVIVGGGPSGLACALRLKQLAADRGTDISVCLLEKGSEVGAHTLSGACIEPRALDELLPDWREDPECPLRTKVTSDSIRFLTSSGSYPLPIVPSQNNHGNYVGSLGALCAWMAGKAEALGVEIFPGFAVAEAVYRGEGAERYIAGVRTVDVGVSRTGERTSNFEPGMDLLANRQVVLAEGSRGSVTKSVLRDFNLTANCQHQKYGLGLKEIWELPDGHRLFEPGMVAHTLGWPLDQSLYGGSWMYAIEENKLSLGMVVSLGYKNPYLSPYKEFQRMKTHPVFKKYLGVEGARCISYGARTLVEGGALALPKLAFPGGVLVGDCAGTLNLPKIKGTHTAMKCGMSAAESIFSEIDAFPEREAGAAPPTLDHDIRFRDSWAGEELHRARNVFPAFNNGMLGGVLYAGLSEYLLKGREPWDLKLAPPDHTCTAPLNSPLARKIDYPKADGKIMFDRLSNLQRSGTNHNNDQRIHLTLKDSSVPSQVNLPKFGGPEQLYCPAGVYEFVNNELVINAQNCLHCKACDIKDPTQNINWVCPEGGGGPAYGASM